MKIKTNFVSNSSSCSFILAVNLQTHEKVIRKLDKMEPELAEFWDEKVSLDFQKLGSEHIGLLYAYFSTENSYCQIGNYYQDVNEKEYDELYRRFDVYRKLVGENCIVKEIE